jgi:hypothetical protein
MLEDFIRTLDPPLLGELVKTVFDKMQLAGEAGSLLKIEEELRTAIDTARKAWEKLESKPRQLSLTKELNKASKDPELTGLEKAVTAGQLSLSTDFWDTAEQQVIDALRAYAEQADADSYQRRLFADDAARGFAFIDLCRLRYDVALMNPPFGDASLPSKPYIDDTYGDTRGDVYKAFVESSHERLVPAGHLGIISSRTGFFLGQSTDWRTRVVLRLFRPLALADLGSGVLDAMVEVAAYVLRNLSEKEARGLTLSLVQMLETVSLDPQGRFSLPKWQAARGTLKRHQAAAELERLESAGFIQRCTGEIVRYTPMWKAVKSVTPPTWPKFPSLVCVRAIEENDKEEALLTAIRDAGAPNRYDSDTGGFSLLSGAPFSYWVGNAVRKLFFTLPQFASSGREAWMGLSSGRDEQWLRLCWEVSPDQHARSRADTIQRRWVILSKGGEFARFYPQLHLVVDWANNGGRLTAWKASELEMGRITANNSKCWNQTKYFRRGLTWSRRSQKGLSVRMLPEGTIFGDKGPGAFAAGDDTCDLAAFAGLFNSAPYRGLVALQMAFGSYEVGVIQRTIVPEWSRESKDELGALARAAWAEKYQTDTTVETSLAYILPALLTIEGDDLRSRVLSWEQSLRASDARVLEIQDQIDELAFILYGLSKTERAGLVANLESNFRNADDKEDEEIEPVPMDASSTVEEVLAYLIGTAFGRWDIRYATGERQPAELPDPFDPLPFCPPGMLQSAEGLPSVQKDLTTDYPLRIPWIGILVDDENHPEDIIAHVQEAIEVIWKNRAEATEQEACEILGVKTLRDYFRRTAAFFADHLKRYSKSRRQAPIYWPLSTKSGNYTLWLYYHRLTEQTLHTCLADFLDPKIKMVQSELNALFSSGQGGTRTGELREFLDELHDLRCEIERIIKLPWKPNLNDGVLITASPLWKLFRLSKWQKDLKACWKKLEKGDFDWAHLAYSIWPKRVEEVCKKDRSIAIAHNLELLCQVEPPKPKRKCRQQKNTDDSIDEEE